MFPQYNKSNENLAAIYNVVEYIPHGDERPVFFVDTTFGRNRKDGVLFTTKGIYRKNKGMISYSPNMQVEVDRSYRKEISVKNTRIISYNGGGKVFDNIADLFQITYIFNNIRHKAGTETSEKDLYEGVWTTGEDGKMHLDGDRLSEVVKERRKSGNGLNDSGVGKNTSDGSVWGVIFWIVILIYVFNSCGA